MESLNIGLFQMDIIWENPEENIIKIKNILNRLDQSIDLLILPEMFTTGFSMKASHFSWDYQHSDFIKMTALSRRYNCSIIGSVWFKENNRFYNRCFHWKPDGEIEHYDKVHLFTLINEDKYISKGTVQTTFNVKNWIIKPQICYDLRFPKESFNSKSKPYDLLIYVANWPEKRINAWSNLLTARAIENQSYVIGVNRVGQEPSGVNYTGQSKAVNYLGENLNTITFSDEGLLFFHLSKNTQNKFRTKFPFIHDS